MSAAAFHNQAAGMMLASSSMSMTSPAKLIGSVTCQSPNPSRRQPTAARKRNPKAAAHTRLTHRWVMSRPRVVATYRGLSLASMLASVDHAVRS